MLRYIIGISLITLTIIGIRFFARDRISKRLQYALWALIPLFMLVSPVFSINVTLPAEDVIVDEQETISSHQHIEGTNQNPMPLQTFEEEKDLTYKYTLGSSSSESSAPVVKINWAKIFTNTAIIVACVFMGAIFIYNVVFVLYCKKRRDFMNVDSLSNLKVYRFDHYSAPFLLGKDIYLNARVASDSNLSRYAILHEYCHYNHGDFIWSVVRYIVLAINWYNPLIWCAFILSEQDCELACDEAVISLVGMEKKVEYGKVLLQLLAENSLGKRDFYLSTGMYGRSKNFMKDRISSIKSNKRFRVVPVVVSLVVAFAATGCSLLKFNKEEPESETSVAIETDHEHYTLASDGNLYVKVNGEEHIAVKINPDDVNSGEDDSPIEGLFDTSFEDGYYTVSMYNSTCNLEVTTNDGVNHCFEAAAFIPWVQVEVTSDYINHLIIGDEVSYTKNVDEEAVIKVEKLDVTTVDPFSRYGTDYTGQILAINDSENYCFYEVEGGETWKLFSSSDTPEFTFSCDSTLPVAGDCVIYDGVTWFIENEELVSSLSDEEREATLSFKDTAYTKDYIDSVNSMYLFRDADTNYYYDYTVIKVENGLITEIYFWLHA